MVQSAEHQDCHELEREEILRFAQDDSLRDQEDRRSFKKVDGHLIPGESFMGVQPSVCVEQCVSALTEHKLKLEL